MPYRGARGALSRIARVVVACGVAGAAALGGCSATKPTELVPGVMTQLRVPRDLRAVQVEVDANGRPVFCQGYDVDQAGVVELPATLGLISQTSPNTTVKVVIRGYDAAGAAAGTYTNTCPDSTPAGTAPAPRVLRTSIQTFVDQHTLFLPMPLSYSCFDQDCSDSASCGAPDCVCKGAQCVAAQTDANKLVDYDPSLVFGNGVCFSPSTCFPPGPGTFAVEPVDVGRCIYEVPAGVGVNVRVLYQDVTWSVAPGTNTYEKQVGNASESEILDADPDEGFCLGACPSAAAGGASPAADAGASAASPADGGAADASGPTATDDGASGPPDAGNAVGAGGTDAGTGAGTTSADAAGPGAGTQRFQLAPGLCKLVKAAHAPPPFALGAPTKSTRTIAEVQVGLGCPSSKSPLLPICAAERNNGPTLDGSGPTTADGSSIQATAETCGAEVPLVSTPSAVYLVMDDSSVMRGAFGSDGYATVMSLSLADPVFNRTYAAFRYLPHTATGPGTFDTSACTSSTTAFSTPAVPFGAATDVQARIADQVKNWRSPGDSEANPAPLDLQAALRPGVGVYSAVTAFLQGKEATNIAAVMLFVNRLPTAANDCDPPLLDSPDIKTAIESEIRAAYAGSPSVRTYFVVLGANGDADPATLAFYQSLQTDLPDMVTTIDATLPSTQASQVLANFVQAAEQLGTCLYEPVSGIGAVQYSDPFAPGSPVAVPANPACNASHQGTVDGWSIDQGRVRMCGAPCSALQQKILEASALAQQTQTPVPEVTVRGTIVCGNSGPIAEDSGAASSAAGDGTPRADGSATADGGPPATRDDAGPADGGFPATGPDATLPDAATSPDRAPDAAVPGDGSTSASSASGASSGSSGLSPRSDASMTTTADDAALVPDASGSLSSSASADDAQLPPSETDSGFGGGNSSSSSLGSGSSSASPPYDAAVIPFPDAAVGVL